VAKSESSIVAIPDAGEENGMEDDHDDTSS